MKTLPAIAAATIAVALLLVPLSAAAAGTLAFTSPTAGASYKGSQAYTISGTISPAPSGADNVAIVVKNPGNQVVDQGNPSVSSGAFSYSTAVGGTSAWTSGTYTITATDTFGATASTQFTYAASGTGTYNVTRALINIQGNLTIINKEIKNLNNDLNGNATAIKATQTTQGQSLASITTSLNSLSQAVSGLQTSITNIGTQVGSINTAVGNLGTQVSTAATNAQHAADAVSSTQTYVLVVAVLAAITLVLELAILVRKLS